MNLACVLLYQGCCCSSWNYICLVCASRQGCPKFVWQPWVMKVHPPCPLQMRRGRGRGCCGGGTNRNQSKPREAIAACCYLPWHALRRNPGWERADSGRVETRVLLKSALDLGQIKCRSASLFWHEDYRSQARPGMSLHSGRWNFHYRQLYLIASHGRSGACVHRQRHATSH